MALETLIIIFTALAVGSLVKGISGLGLPLIAIPVMAGFMEVYQAVAIMIFPRMLTNGYLLWAHRNHAVKLVSLPSAILVGILGIVFGSWILSSTPGEYLLLFMSLWLGGYLLSLLFSKKVELPRVVTQNLSMIVVALGGIIQGAIGTAGPILASYIHSLRLKHGEFMFAVSVLFQIFAFAQLLAFIWFGLMDLERTYLGLLACIPVIIFLPVAVRLSTLFSERASNGVVIALLVLIEARLIWRLVN